MEYKYTITLFSDAQPGTGLGGEMVNDFIPRDGNGKPFLPASTLKGLMREAGVTMFERLNLNKDFIGTVFGNRYQNDPFKGESLVVVSDAIVKEINSGDDKRLQEQTLFVSRTALDDCGTAKEGSLRTSEAIAVGTQFSGTMRVNATSDSAADILARLCLLSITVLGGSRNRGCGRCQINFVEERFNTVKDQVLKLIDALKTESSRGVATCSGEKDLTSEQLGKLVTVRLTFRAQSPVCVPETVWVGKNNTVSSGFTIPASAVRGALIRQPQLSDRARTELYNCKSFIVSPLQPCSDNRDSSLRDSNKQPDSKNLPVSVRVSLTHKVAKFSLKEPLETDFEDVSIPPYRVEDVADRAPMKASDGVLLVYDDGTIRLWKASDMPHWIQMHGVHRNALGESERNLYTVDSIAPLVWRGITRIPQSVLDILFEGKPDGKIPIAFGTRRSVQGQGTLQLEPIDDKQRPIEWQANKSGNWDKTVFVVQSPISLFPCSESPVLSSSDSVGSTVCSIGDGNVESVFKKRVADWLTKHGIETVNGAAIAFEKIQTWASVGYQFGWNGKFDGQQSGRSVILPGSVIQLPVLLSQEQVDKLVYSGFDLDEDDFKRGYGAICVHPGKAKDKYSGNSTVVKMPEDDFRKQWVETMVKLSAKPLPSPSQISALREELRNKGKTKALAYLKNQNERQNVSDAWSACSRDIEAMLNQIGNDTKKQVVVIQILELLGDLAIAKQAEKR